MSKYNLFLDDFRIPSDAFNYTHDHDFLKLKWQIVRSHKAFCEYIEDNFKKDGSFPSIVAFDHDLDDAHYNHTRGEIPYEELNEKTGYHSAIWLTEFCTQHDLNLPLYKVHSMNSVGRANIKAYLTNYLKHFPRKNES